jgi:hypothetical protein
MTAFVTTLLSGGAQSATPFRSRLIGTLGEARDSFRSWRTWFTSQDRDQLRNGPDQRVLLLLGRD